MNQQMIPGTRDGDVVRGVVAGTIGGLVASWAMSHFQAEWSRRMHGVQLQSSGGRHDAREWQERTEGQNATEVAAQKIAEATLDRPLTRKELSVAAPAVHYAFGAAMGAVYGGLAEVISANPLTGAAFGTLVWAVGDEIAVPALGLSRAPESYTPDAHAQALASHIVYGVTTDIVRRGVRKVL